MLINNETWADLFESYGHVQIDDMHQADKDRIFKEAVNSHSDELQAIVAELVADDWVRPIVWQSHRHAQAKMTSELWAHVHATAQDEADEWEGLDCE